MKSRKEAAEYISAMLNDDDIETFSKKGRHHWGWYELRHIMDFIYEGEPESKEEELTNVSPIRY